MGFVPFLDSLEGRTRSTGCVRKDLKKGIDKQCSQGRSNPIPSNLPNREIAFALNPSGRFDAKSSKCLVT